MFVLGFFLFLFVCLLSVLFWFGFFVACHFKTGIRSLGKIFVRLKITLTEFQLLPLLSECGKTES